MTVAGRRFSLVDVFGVAPFSGNPLAVVAGAEGLDADEMQRITRWLNLSETAFLLPPTDPRADYRVRIFTLAHELPFAGHPTLGACHAWLEGGGVSAHGDRIVQQCGAGLVEVRRGPDGLAFTAPPLIRSGEPDESIIAEAAAVLNIPRSAIVDARWIDNGPGWLGLMLASAEAVRALRPARSHDGRVDLGIVGPCDPSADADFEIRAFFSDGQGGLVEDPVTGSLNASVAQWLYATGRVTASSYRAAQGTCLGRAGRVQVMRDGDAIWIGGHTATLFQGHMRAPPA